MHLTVLYEVFEEPVLHPTAGPTTTPLNGLSMRVHFVCQGARRGPRLGPGFREVVADLDQGERDEFISQAQDDVARVMANLHR